MPNRYSFVPVWYRPSNVHCALGLSVPNIIFANSCYFKQYKSIVCFFFSFIALWLVQYVSGGSAQTQQVWCPETCCILVCPIQATKNMHNMSPKCFCNHPSFFEKDMDLIIHRWEKQEVGNTFVLPAVTTMCTYNEC